VLAICVSAGANVLPGDPRPMAYPSPHGAKPAGRRNSVEANPLTCQLLWAAWGPEPFWANSDARDVVLGPGIYRRRGSRNSPKKYCRKTGFFPFSIKVIVVY